MRDRETDSWWSIMTSSAIGGDLEGADLAELPYGEKMTWKDWRRRYPDTLVLSVGGSEHIENNPYDGYFASDETFRGLRIEDTRLEPKASIYSFWLNGEPYAAPHDAFEGGRLFQVSGLEGRQILLYREPGSAIFEGTRAYLVSEALATSSHTLREIVEMAESGDGRGIEKLPGFDTFWYNWIAVNEDSQLLR